MGDIRLMEIEVSTAPVDGDIAVFDAVTGIFVPRQVVARHSISLGFYSTAPAGFVLMKGTTIGDASSAATERANIDCENLFKHIWDNLADAQAPVVGGRGASAAADWAAHKKITLPDTRQRVILGQAAAGTGVTLGGTGGAVDHTHSEPAHYHSAQGTGADIAVTSSGTHTTSISHDHPSVTTTSNGPAASEVGNAGTAQATVVSAGTRLSWDNANTKHTHNVDLPNFVGNSSSDGAHTHPHANVTGKVGLVTGGVNGDAAMTTGANNPPFLTATFIIGLY